jgi:hypothetical protein
MAERFAREPAPATVSRDRVVLVDDVVQSDAGLNASKQPTTPRRAVSQRHVGEVSPNWGSSLPHRVWRTRGVATLTAALPLSMHSVFPHVIVVKPPCPRHEWEGIRAHS